MYESNPRFSWLGVMRSPSTSTISSPAGIAVSPWRTLSNMNTLRSGDGGPSLNGGPSQYGISNTRADSYMSNSIHGYSNQNVGNMSNCYNNTINLGTSEESLRIQAWLSPLELGRRHQDVRNRRVGGVGDWVLQRNEFESWRNSRDGSEDVTLGCYGGQGVGKTYIRYRGGFQNQRPSVFATVQSVRLRGRTGRTMARSPSFWGC